MATLFHLLPTTSETASWIAWQFNGPEQGSGVIEAFRHADSPFSSARFPLHPSGSARYLYNKRTGWKPCKLLTGAELMRRGLFCFHSAHAGTMVILYRKARIATGASRQIIGAHNRSLSVCLLSEKNWLRTSKRATLPHIRGRGWSKCASAKTLNIEVGTRGAILSEHGIRGRNRTFNLFTKCRCGLLDTDNLYRSSLSRPWEAMVAASFAPAAMADAIDARRAIESAE